MDLSKAWEDWGRVPAARGRLTTGRGCRYFPAAAERFVWVFCFVLSQELALLSVSRHQPPEMLSW